MSLKDHPKSEKSGFIPEIGHNVTKPQNNAIRTFEVKCSLSNIVQVHAPNEFSQLVRFFKEHVRIKTPQFHAPCSRKMAEFDVVVTDPKRPRSLKPGKGVEMDLPYLLRARSSLTWPEVRMHRNN